MHNTETDFALGLDIGTKLFGYAVMARDGELMCSNVLRISNNLPLYERYRKIYQCVLELDGRWQPNAAGYESTFVGNNHRSSLVLAQAIGAVAVALHCKIYTDTATRIRKMILGVESGKVGARKWCKANGYKPVTRYEDETDAILIAEYARRKHYGKT